MKIGIFGGSFDPVHTGHIRLAEEVIRKGFADKVVFMPAAKQPFKLDRKMASGEDRLNMVKLAIEGLDSMEVSTYELDRAGEVSYTVNTLNAMQEQYGADAEIALIQGADTFLQIHKWTRHDEILKKYTLIVGVRPGYNQKELDEQEMFLKREFGARIERIDNPFVNISSTEIRNINSGNNASDGLSSCNMIPIKVKDYIIEKGLYNQIY